MKNNITFRMLAYTDPAGKKTIGAVREGNEDNYYADDDLSDNKPGSFVADQVVEMSEYGLLMVVADGMGGQNAGEVASQIAVDTVKEYFSPGMISDKNASSHRKRGKYMEEVIKEADNRIKIDAKHNPERHGMGSTIIMAWIVGNELTLSWCGDSRAYRYNPNCGIELISKDHSYVQELADKGIITYDDTFDHPQGNIVTRSLGDSTQKAKPETREFSIFKDDIILLCSDGLSGVLRDKKTYDHEGNLYPGDNIEDIINENHTCLVECRDALLKAAEEADWYDNVTIVMCEILDGVDTAANNKSYIYKDKEAVVKKTNFFSKTLNFTIKFTPKTICFILSGLFALILCGLLINRIKFGFNGDNISNGDSASVKTETVNLKEDVVAQTNERTQLDENKQSLSRKVNTIQEELKSIDNLKDSLNRLAQNVDAADNQTKLDLLVKQVESWNYKAKYLKKIYVEICTVKDKTKKDLLQALYDSVLNSNQDNHTVWEQSLQTIIAPSKKVIEPHRSTKQNQTPTDEELTISDDSSLTITAKFTITNSRNSSYQGIVTTLERNNPGYKVVTIKLENGSTISSQQDIENTIPKNKSMQAESLLKKK